MIHLVWVPKYRKRILRGKLSSRIDELLRLCAESNGWKVLELNVQQDHVHMVVQFVPTIAVSKMVQLLKGKSSRVIREEFPELEEVYWGDSFWADGYFAETAGKCDIQVVLDYVKNQ
jgi:putative transposase